MRLAAVREKISPREYQHAVGRNRHTGRGGHFVARLPTRPAGELSSPSFRAALEQCDAAIAAIAGWSVIEELLAPADRSRLEETEIAQPVNFALQVALAAPERASPTDAVTETLAFVVVVGFAGALSVTDGPVLSMLMVTVDAVSLPTLSCAWTVTC